MIRTKNSIIGITQLLFLQKNCLIAAFNDLDAFLIPIIAQVIPNTSNELEPSRVCHFFKTIKSKSY